MDGGTKRPRAGLEQPVRHLGLRLGQAPEDLLGLRGHGAEPVGTDPQVASQAVKKMKIFVSWSGEQSRKLATALDGFLQGVGFDTWMSDRALRAGELWPQGTLDALKRSTVCVACVTRENLESGWMHFEAGAVSRRLAVLSGLEKAQLTGPLGYFQSFDLDPADIRRLVGDLHDVAGREIPEPELDRRFAEHWPRLRDYDLDPIRLLFEATCAAKAPYLLASAAHVWQNAEHRREAAIRELAAEVRDLKPEARYLGAASKLIEERSVWAVCGRKSENAWIRFLQANETSHGRGRRIERIFFPPDETEKESILEVIARHLETGMVVRVFPSVVEARDVYSQWNLPVGFGMTLMGTEEPGTTNPANLDAVLVHWGGVGSGGADHYGVILRHPLWTEHFWKVFSEIRGNADPELVGPMSREEFKARYPHYT